MEDYRIEGKLGEGAQGVVYRVTHVHSGLEYAMKVICCSDQDQVNAALKEIKVLLQLRHPHIVSYVDFFLVFNNAKTRSEFEKGDGQAADSNGNGSGYHVSVVDAARSSTTPLEEKGAFMADTRGHFLREEEIAVCLVMELCSCGDMQGTIKQSKQEVMSTAVHPLAESQVLTWLSQCASALEFIHEKGFLHRDLKPTNVFFDAQRNIKIGDFGLAAAVGLGRQSAVGTPHYLAPERMLQERYDGKVDIWCLGVVVLELVTLRELPVNSLVLENPEIVNSIVEGVVKMGFSGKLSRLLRDMLQRRPDDRPSASALTQRVASMSVAAPHPGMSASIFAGISCPKLPADATKPLLLCGVCEVESATKTCPMCSTVFCEGCDAARHRHPSRQSHERSSTMSNNNITAMQTTLSTSRATHAANLSEQGRSMQNASFVPLFSPTFSGQDSSVGFVRPSAGERELPSISHSAISTRREGLSSADTTIRVPADFPSVAAAITAAHSLPHIRKILIAAGTVLNEPLTLTSALPSNIRIVGESPPPVIEVSDSPFALCCASGKGVIENIVIRHLGHCTSRRKNVLQDVDPSSGNASQSKEQRKQPRSTAVSIIGGEWRLHKCRISCVEGNGVTVGGKYSSRHTLITATTTVNNTSAAPHAAVSRHDADNSLLELSSEAMVAIDPIVTKCSFVDINGAGVVVMEKCRGTYESNSFTGCGYAAFLLKKESSPQIRSNQIMDGADSGIFCHDAHGTIEYNLIAQNTGCGVVVRGPHATTVFRRNRILSNAQAGFICCDRAAPFISDNEIRLNDRAGVLVKTRATPKVSHNIIEDGKEVGVYVFEQGGGIIEENRISGNKNAGILVASEGNPHVIRNVLSKNAYEGVWVCRNGRGTFCENDLCGNVRGAKDIDADCHVIWIGNRED